MNAIHVFSFGVIQVMKMIRVSGYVALLFVMSVGVACGPLDPSPNDGSSGGDGGITPTPSQDMGGSSQDDQGAGGEATFVEPATQTTYTTQDITLTEYTLTAAVQFSPDGNRLAMIAQNSSTSTYELVVTDLEASTFDVVISSSEQLGNSSDLRWHPSGEQILFSHEDTISVVSASPSSNPEQIIDINTLISGFDISSDGATLIWGDSIGLSASLNRASYTGGLITRAMTTEIGSGHKPYFSGDASKMVYSEYGIDSHTLVATSDLSEQLATLEELPVTITSVAGWLDDERFLIAGTQGIMHVDLANTTVETFSDTGYASYLDVSKDGKKAIMTTQQGFKILTF